MKAFRVSNSTDTASYDGTTLVINSITIRISAEHLHQILRSHALIETLHRLFTEGNSLSKLDLEDLYYGED